MMSDGKLNGAGASVVGSSRTSDRSDRGTYNRTPNTEYANRGAYPDRTPNTTVWLGTSGYSFHCWEGTFYPLRLPLTKRLEYYAAHFETVELNYTFYRMPTRRTSDGMVRATPPGFRFFVKGHQNFTHHGCLDDAGRFLEGIQPFVHASRLDGLLFQFPQSFKNTRCNRDYLHRLVDCFSMHHLAIEFRDRSWDRPWIYRYMEDHRLSIVAVDAPEISTLFPKIPVATNEIGYVRLHSSNGEKWYAGDERYDYNYSEGELQEWTRLLGVIGERSKNIFVYFNNCHRGQAAQNAREMKRVIAESGLALEVGTTIDRSVNSIEDGLWAS